MSTLTQNAQTYDLAQLVKAHQSGVWRYIRFAGASSTEADDLVQETFLAFMKSNFEYQSDTATAAYLRQVARNQLMQRRRQQGREINSTQLAATEAVWVEVAPTDGLDDYLTALRGCIEQLRGRPSAAIELHYRQGLGRTLIAEQLGMSPEGIKTLLRRTRQRLRECVERKVKPSD